MKPVIRISNVSKMYQLGARQNKYGTLRDSLTEAAGAPLRWLRKRTNKSVREKLWALKDVSLNVAQGEVVGIIGRNGAGKSTLLKIISRITEPTSGRIELWGRVASLLEVGTGFHSELSGRENIYLNGAILGMKKAEIDRNFDQIVAFSEIEKFIDTPVKHYSSGMFVRLAFAVAAHLEPEVLIVDEVLAVGDLEFQKKCLGKMNSVAQEGRTVLIVSHNMPIINKLCERVVLLAGGKVGFEGKTSDVVAEYLKLGGGKAGEWLCSDAERSPGNDRIRLQAVRISSLGAVTADIDIDKEITIEVDFWNLVEGAKNLCVNIYLLDSMGNTVLSTANTPSANLIDDRWFTERHPSGLFRARCTLPGNFLNEGLFYVSVFVLTLGPIVVEATAEQIVSFIVHDTGSMREPGAGSRWDGVVRVRLPWQTEYVQPLVGDVPMPRLDTQLV